VPGPSQHVAMRFLLRMCACDSRFVNLLFPHRWLRGKNLESVIKWHVRVAIKLVEHLHELWVSDITSLGFNVS